MYFWLFLVIIVSVMENWSSCPFSKSWTMRVSRAPKNIEVPSDAPRICRSRKNEEQGIGSTPSEQDYQSDGKRNILKKLADGVDSECKVIVFEGEPHTRSRSCFYVVVSKEGISWQHAAIKVVSKGSSLAVYAFGTALFAAAQLMSISVALMILSIVLGCAAFGRINGMFIASEMNNPREPILHAVVQGDEDAAKHIESVLAEPDLVVEIMGHIIVNGAVVARQNPWFSLATYIGLLAPPFNLNKIGVPSHNPLSRKATWQSSMSGLEMTNGAGAGFEGVELLQRS